MLHVIRFPRASKLCQSARGNIHHAHEYKETAITKKASRLSSPVRLYFCNSTKYSSSAVLIDAFCGLTFRPTTEFGGSAEGKVADAFIRLAAGAALCLRSLRNVHEKKTTVQWISARGVERARFYFIPGNESRGGVPSRPVRTGQRYECFIVSLSARYIIHLSFLRLSHLSFFLCSHWKEEKELLMHREATEDCNLPKSFFKLWHISLVISPPPPH